MAITRRTFLARTAATAAWAAAATTPFLRESPAWASGSCALGVWSNKLDALQRELGFTFCGIRYNQGMQAPVPTAHELEWHDEGHWLIYRNLNAQIKKGSTHPVCISWRAIANGHHDDYFSKAARALKSSKRFSRTRPYLFSFHHEQKCNSSHQCGGRACGTPADYVAAYRHVRRTFDRVGATVSEGGNVRFVWSPLSSQFHMADGPWGAPKVDPGPQYYDYVGVDAYNRRWHSKLLFSDPAELLGPAHAYAKKRGKRLIIAEYGVADGPKPPSHIAKAQFLLDTAETIKSWGPSGPGSVLAWYFTSVDSYRLDSSPAVLSAVRRVASFPFFR